MERPSFDRFHPNASACNNACDCAESKEWRKALDWLQEAQSGSEYLELSDNATAAEEYVNHLATQAGVDLGTVPEELPEPGPQPKRFTKLGTNVGDALQALVRRHSWLAANGEKLETWKTVTVRVRRACWPAVEDLSQFSVRVGCTEDSYAFVRHVSSPNTHYKTRSELWVPSYEELTALDWEVEVTWLS